MSKFTTVVNLQPQYEREVTFDTRIKVRPSNYPEFLKELRDNICTTNVHCFSLEDEKKSTEWMSGVLILKGVNGIDFHDTYTAFVTDKVMNNPELYQQLMKKFKKGFDSWTYLGMRKFEDETREDIEYLPSGYNAYIIPDGAIQKMNITVPLVKMGSGGNLVFTNSIVIGQDIIFAGHGFCNFSKDCTITSNSFTKEYCGKDITVNAPLINTPGVTYTCTYPEGTREATFTVVNYGQNILKDLIKKIANNTTKETDDIQSRINSMNDDLEKLKLKVNSFSEFKTEVGEEKDSIQQQINNLQTQVNNIDSYMTKLTQEIQNLKEKIEDEKE